MTLGLGSAWLSTFTLFWTALTFLLSDQPNYRAAHHHRVVRPGRAGRVRWPRKGRGSAARPGLVERCYRRVLGAGPGRVHHRGGRGPHRGRRARSRSSCSTSRSSRPTSSTSRGGLRSPARPAAGSTPPDITGNFIGGAIGSAAATALWSSAGGTAVSGHGGRAELRRARSLGRGPPRPAHRRQRPTSPTKSLDIAQWAKSAQHGGNCVTEVTSDRVTTRGP